MKKNDIKRHFGRYSIYQKRATTINHAFASAMAPTDEYHEETVDRILEELECLQGGKIMCLYCGRHEAQTWDHLYALVNRSEPSGFGHKYGNLVPSCKDCNSKKGNRDWQTANDQINSGNEAQRSRVQRLITDHLAKYPPKGDAVSPEFWNQVNRIRLDILELMKRADEVIAAHLGKADRADES